MYAKGSLPFRKSLNKYTIKGKKKVKKNIIEKKVKRKIN